MAVREELTMRTGRWTTAVALSATALLFPMDATRADDSGRVNLERPDHDVRVQLKVRGKRRARLRIEVKVKNRGRLDEERLHVVLHDGDPDDPVWSKDLDLDSGKRKKFRFRIEREDVGGVLTAELHDAGSDDEPIEDSEDVTPGTSSDANAAARGRDLYVPLCSGCHGDDGRGGTVDENIARESWDEFVEAFREGEDGMPTYPALASRDARDIVAYLRDPSAATLPPPPPVEPPPANTTPTYTQHVKSILDRRCASCHGSSFPAAGIALDTYGTASRNASASLASIRAGRMPTSGSLPTTEIETIAAWVAGGLPE
jgi:mono/diheme cytochrome c family protein